MASSTGSECLPLKQEDVGSTPTPPTNLGEEGTMAFQLPVKQPQAGSIPAPPTIVCWIHGDLHIQY